MSYVALYRKFRPQTFEEVKGQEHIVTTLRNQIKSDRIGHAYLFCGTRGTGKTTIAKLFARAVNCENPIDGSPCNECKTCKAILSGTSMNVIEIDAASNNGVENIRDIREEVAYSPAEGKYKVYIIDEVHMLSIGAFNALLKTLEEPPSYVIFILATTEVHKIPITIQSRCQRYDFKRIMINTISDRLKELSNVENVDIEDRALNYIAKVADGSMRDALSLLDRCVAFYLGKPISYDDVLDVLGAVDTEAFSKMLRFIIKNDIHGALLCLEEIIMQGKELTQFITDFIWYLRNLLLIKNSDKMEDVIDVSTENLALLKDESKMVDFNTLMRYIRILSDLNNQIKYTSQKRVIIEIALIKLCKPQMEQDIQSIEKRVSDIEKALEKGVMVSSDHMNEPSKEPKVKQELPKALSEDVKLVVKRWKEIIAGASGLIKNYANNAKLSVSADNRLLLVFDDIVASGYMSKPEVKAELEQLIMNKINKRVEIEVSSYEKDSSFTDNFLDIEKLINMDIVIEDIE